MTFEELDNKLPNSRIVFLLLFFASIALMLGALYFQYVMELAPCPLCITQRIFVIAVGLVGFIAFFHNPKGVMKRIYAILCVLFAVCGGGVSARHTWLQNLPEDQVPACGPGLSYMFDALPFWEALSVLFAGDGNCADELWTFLGLSIPGWTLVCFIGMALVSLYLLIRKN